MTEQLRIKSIASDFFREDVLLHPADALPLGLASQGRLAIWAIDPLVFGVNPEKRAVRIVLDDKIEPGVAVFNENLLQESCFDIQRQWWLEPCAQVRVIRSAVLEIVTEQSMIAAEMDRLRRNRKQLFENRCLLLEPEKSLGSLALSVNSTRNQGASSYFNIRSIQPELQNIGQATALVFDENTELSFFVPHRRSGVDMVILVDGSNSMDLLDYVNEMGVPSKRLDGARAALDSLFQKRLISGTRISRMAVIAFAGNTCPIYPRPGSGEPCMVEIQGVEQLAEIRRSLQYIDTRFLESRLERAATELPQAIQSAAELLDTHFREGNEKLIVLLSDGADWQAEEDQQKGIELISATSNAALLAESLHHESNVRFCTVAISNPENVRLYEQAFTGRSEFAPNVDLLRHISDCTDGIFFDQPNAQALAKLFDELGQGNIYNL